MCAPQADRKANKKVSQKERKTDYVDGSIVLMSPLPY